MRQFWTSVIVALAAATVVAAPKFLSVWKSPDVARLNFAGKKVAALVITDDQPLQMSGEEALVRELADRGVSGLATYRIVPREELKNPERAKEFFARASVEGVVALRPVSRDREQEYSPVVWVSVTTRRSGATTDAAGAPRMSSHRADDHDDCRGDAGLQRHDRQAGMGRHERNARSEDASGFRQGGSSSAVSEMKKMKRRVAD